MISKQLTPWYDTKHRYTATTNGSSIRYITQDLAGNSIAYISVLMSSHPSRYVSYMIIGDMWDMAYKSGFTSINDAMVDCNKKLKSLGYEFISEERAEKLRLLL